MTFPDHYDPDDVEQYAKRHWNEVDAYEHVNAENADGEPFYFVDGPPNTSGDMHCGTAWGKVLKDAFLRYYRMQGRNVVARPGYDTHGLPVERRLEAELGFEGKRDVHEYSVENFVGACREFVAENRQGMDEEFADLGVWMDWDDPYRTMDTEYMETVWTAFHELYDSGLLSREKQVVNTCPDCETSVAETRLSYETRDSTAAYVGFPLRERDGWLLTWTTTPWTVTGNQFVAVDPEATYVAVDVGGELLYVAEECVDGVLEAVAEDAATEVVDRFAGADLVGWGYDNPLARHLPADSPVRGGEVATADYVDLEKTGLVHSAPGYGAEDFERGRELGLDGYAPLDETGTLTAGAGAYAGLDVKEAVDAVLVDLDDAGALFATESHAHEYPQCPRCDAEVRYRATEQWVVRVTEFKQDLLDAVDGTAWFPPEARENRFRPMVADAPDWNLSRQRYWGTPVPVWICEDCGEDVVVENATDLAENAGLDEVPDDLHRPTVDDLTVECQECGGTARREEDVLDVWFDSAVASWASARVRPPETPEYWPADLVVEGHDQTRGWFLMQLYLGVAFADRAPYQEVLMHGFAELDGEAMSKSRGHVLRPPTVVEKHGRDPLRAQLLSHNPTKDVSLTSDMEGVADLEDELDVVWNVYRFALLYMDLDGYDPVPEVQTDPDDRTVLDDWVLSRLQATVAEVNAAMDDERRTDRALGRVLDFLVDDVSRYYVKTVRDRVWEGDDGAYDALGTVLCESAKLLAPFVPFLAERLYDALDQPELTVHAATFPEADPELRDTELEAVVERLRRVEETAATARQRAGRKQRWPVAEVVVETDDERLQAAVRQHRDLFERRLNAEDVVVTRAYDRLVGTPDPRMDELGPAFGEQAHDVAAAVCEDNVTEFPATVTVDGESITVESKMVDMRTETPESVESEPFEFGTVYVDATLTTSLKREGVYRDVLRRAQELRDDLDVEMDEEVVLAVDTDDTLVREAMKQYHEELLAEVRAERVVDDTEDADVTHEWSADGASVEVGARRAG
ncbi:isoleucine--tRNA ligase [Halobacteriales archaeon SW_7_65_23]|nr:MAG: isoleucine--tRNA ligase [Halobacteriales archaeon SW_7_65_23]